ncbi:YceI family protein [Nocardiopsis ansamitocini]|uniref:Lipid/polyisoprenoid-binding YceI-like domain-containing protein n=1 Tax=Nocardiopsis ansamitocini TaxID=1670832 RepID=A0A9W6P3Q6_9ACTN|nr:YceI family protein [Nocardiopsis ansamitocini]GLU46558.1 hypothetical protein Nans01_09090 [Nocardiopsis ansamitocini]
MDIEERDGGRLHLLQPIGERSVPQADTWYIDPVHSSVGFAAGMQGLARVRGRFNNLSGVVWVADKPEESSASVTIDATAIDTGITRRDDHLKSPEFLDVGRFPVLSWHGHRVEPTVDDGLWTFHGDLTVRDVTLPVPLRGRFLGQCPYPFGDAELACFSATATLDRFDFGLDVMGPLPGAKLFIGRRVEINLEVAMINTDIRFFTERFLSPRRAQRR